MSSLELLHEGITENKDNQLSLYQPGKVTSKTLADCIIEVKKAFPKLPVGWYDVLERMLDDEKFSDKRLIDATKNLIKNCVYPEPTIANIISFDRTIKVFTYNELLTVSKDYSAEQRGEHLNNFEKVDFYGQERWAKKEDVIRFNLSKWTKK